MFGEVNPLDHVPGAEVVSINTSDSNEFHVSSDDEDSNSDWIDVPESDNEGKLEF